MSKRIGKLHSKSTAAAIREDNAQPYGTVVVCSLLETSFTLFFSSFIRSIGCVQQSVCMSKLHAFLVSASPTVHLPEKHGQKKTYKS